MGIIGKEDSLKFIGLGVGGFITANYLSTCLTVQSLVEGVMMVNAPYHLTPKLKEMFNSLIELFSVEDSINEENAFLFYSKAIGQQLSGEEIETKAGLNSIRPKGRVYLMKSLLEYW